MARGGLAANVVKSEVLEIYLFITNPGITFETLYSGMQVAYCLYTKTRLWCSSVASPFLGFIDKQEDAVPCLQIVPKY